MINKNKLYFFASLMTFCFAKSVTFDVNVNVGAASLSNVKSKINKKAPLLSPEWYFAEDPAAGMSDNLRYVSLNDACGGDNMYWSKDGGATWTPADAAVADDDVNTFGSKASYQNYVTSVAKDYALEVDYERHHYEYKDSIRNQKGGFAAGLDVGVRYELTPCVKIGARAFFTATNLKQDVSYSVTPVDKNGNFASATARNEREVQMLIGYAQSGVGDAKKLTDADAQQTLIDGITLKRGANNVVLGSENDASTNAAHRFTAVFGMSINRDGYEALKNAEKTADGYALKLSLDNYGQRAGINFTKTGSGAATTNGNVTEYVDSLFCHDDDGDEIIRYRNYSVANDKFKFNRLATTAGNDPEIDSIILNSRAVNVIGPRVESGLNSAGADAETIAQATIPQAIGITTEAATQSGQVAEGDILTLSEEKYNEIMQAFEEMSADFDQTVIDQTLKVKNVWGGMVTLSWNATDCTLFTLGLGVGVPSVSKIDNLKKKVGFAGMFEVSTKIADSFSVGLRYQYNRINLKEKDCDSAVHHLSKVNGNLHVFSANFTYAF